MPFTHILVPTDFSDQAHHAFTLAVEEATLHRAKVTLLHVLGTHTDTEVYYVTQEPGQRPPTAFDPVAGGSVGSPPPPPPTVVRRDRGEEMTNRLRDLIPGAFRDAWDVEVAPGHPADAIVRVAQERGVDLIVMGTHGRTGLQHMLIGSVAEKVVRLAPCPVLTVRHARMADTRS